MLLGRTPVWSLVVRLLKLRMERLLVRMLKQRQAAAAAQTMERLLGRTTVWSLVVLSLVRLL